LPVKTSHGKHHGAIFAAILDITEPRWRMTPYYRLHLPKLHPAAEEIIRKNEASVVKRTAKAQFGGAVKKGFALRQYLRKVSEQVHPKGSNCQDGRCSDVQKAG
jgi:hypothetical protein